MPPSQSPQKTPLIEARKICVEKQGRQLFQDFSFSLHKGEKVCISAPSGRGKTVFLRILAGLEKPDQGDLLFNGKPYNARGCAALYRQLNWLPQRVSLLGETVQESLFAPFELRNNHDRKPDKTGMMAALGKAGLSDTALDQSTSQLSGGERQRLAIATAILLERPLWIADEPTASLDKERAISCGELLLNTCETLIAVTHDPELLALFPTKIELPDVPAKGDGVIR
ncbi:ATP-binding cassette domain-containing protein [Pseudovibrio sp. Tun.PSC04-5.I4]|uniref:ABC transporter ATP-binding protein n=1 Tax=Pseudovibrio sp. Tun.PSC04-5.I4 TaxID=1798213 RepID=UPI00088FADE0|nr:ATP-binding cassette domain-containing protein [Pseudovibrio sp. Tun.PSC04-5.I4]SDQ98313.1 putative ABC transport system ATP-binding protein [Pseudovibrio sp. Tun.PSC04-5.I4]